MCKYPVRYEISHQRIFIFIFTTTSGPLQLLLQQDNLPGAELCSQGGHPGETQPAETEGGQGGGDGRDQLSPARSLKHEETGKNYWPLHCLTVNSECNLHWLGGTYTLWSKNTTTLSQRILFSYFLPPITMKMTIPWHFLGGTTIYLVLLHPYSRPGMKKL